MASGGSKEEKVIFGIDFGTTFSSAVYLFCSRDDPTEILQRGFYSNDMVKAIAMPGSMLQTASVLGYSSPQQQGFFSRGLTAQWVWGSLMQQEWNKHKVPEMGRFSLMKLGLARAGPTSSIRELLQTKLQYLPDDSDVNSIDDLIAMYFRLLRREVKKQWSMMHPKETQVLMEDAETIFTIPATWSLEMDFRMRRAAQAAGWSNVTTVSEPEAAAYFLHSNANKVKGPLSQPLSSDGGSFMILDVGGGTADAVTYTIKNGFLQKSVVSEGNVFGSSKLNEAFAELFFRLMAVHEQPLLAQWTRKNTGGKVKGNARQEITEYAMGQFEEVKKWIDGPSEGDGRRVRVDLSELGTINGSRLIDGQIFLSWDEVVNIFMIIIGHIRKLIRSQEVQFQRKFKKHIQHCYFVGGTSGNGLILSELQKTFPNTTKPEAEVVNFIAKGAIIQHLHRDLIGEKVARFSIGHTWDEIYEKRLHGPAKAPQLIYEHYEKEWRIKRRINWLIKARDKIIAGDPIFTLGQSEFPLDGSSWIIEQEIYTSETLTGKHLSADDPDLDITRQGTVSVELDENNTEGFNPLDEFEKDGEPWVRFEYQLRLMYEHNSSVRFEFWIPKQGYFNGDANNVEETLCFGAEMNIDDIWNREVLTKDSDEESVEDVEMEVRPTKRTKHA